MMNTECNHSKGDMNVEAKSSSSGSYGKFIEVVIMLILIGSYYYFIHGYYYSITVNTAALNQNGEEVFVAGQNKNVVEEIVNVAQVSIVATNVTIHTKEITLAQALAELKSTKPKAKGIVLQELEPEKPLKKKDQLKLDEEIALKLQAEIDEEERIARVAEEKIDEANIAWDDIQAKVDVDYQLAERRQAEEQ
ncbi:hypothetical protein Tco_0909667 [Tanacetum coccineum]|uniref:Uncharacterized protein n=1 Tax=Tanacetum coccineum TaxID=301880 RepID=A0ABQ5CSL6_9ASTR